MSATPNRLVVSAPAKINLSLEILGTRPDGYHELVSVMQTVSLRDRLVLSRARGATLDCNDPALSGEQNLAFRAGALLRQRFGDRFGFRISLTKSVPDGAGLGGGSSDGAASLVGLNILWSLGAGCEELHAMAEALGSDVPFFLCGGTALVEGRGELVAPLPEPTPAWFVLASPAVRVSTAQIFAELDASAWTDGITTRRLAAELGRTHKVRLGYNGLQDTLFRLYPEARANFEKLESLAPGRTIVSGSGGTAVALFDEESRAVSAAALLGESETRVAVVRTEVPPAWQTPCR